MVRFKSRPRIRLRAPIEIRPGEQITLTVLLDCSRPVDVDSIVVTLEGVEQTTASPDSTRVTARNTLVRARAVLAEEISLPAGTTELPARFTVPEDAPPSYEGARATIRYTCSVHVDIPWWPDRKSDYELHVVPIASPGPPVVQSIISSDPDGPSQREAHVEVSLGGNWSRPGGTVSGALALSNVAYNRYREAFIGLRPVEAVYRNGQIAAQLAHLRYGIRLNVATSGEGERIPFAFRLPANAPAGFPPTPRPGGNGALCALRWLFEIVVRVGSRELTMHEPFQVLHRSPRNADSPPRLAPPAVGSDRLRAVWESVGAEHGLDYVDQTLRTIRNGIGLSVRRDHSGFEGVFLVTELSYPDLGLDLVVERSTRLSRLLRGGVDTGQSDWDRKYGVRARDLHQAAAFLRRLVPVLGPAPLFRFDDTGLVIRAADSGRSRSQKRMHRLVAHSLSVVDALNQLRNDMPPPSAMHGALPAWRQLAEQLKGELETARMRITGSSEAVSPEVALEFDEDGYPVATWLEVTPTLAIDDQFLLCARNAEEAADRARGYPRSDLRPLLKQLTAGARELLIERTRIAVCLPAVLGGVTVGQLNDVTPTLALEEVERLLDLLRRLASSFRGQTGPYR